VAKFFNEFQDALEHGEPLSGCYVVDNERWRKEVRAYQVQKGRVRNLNVILDYTHKFSFITFHPSTEKK
jgi:hypothetical protein